MLATLHSWFISSLSILLWWLLLLLFEMCLWKVFLVKYRRRIIEWHFLIYWDYFLLSPTFEAIWHFINVARMVKELFDWPAFMNGQFTYWREKKLGDSLNLALISKCLYVTSKFHQFSERELLYNMLFMFQSLAIAILEKFFWSWIFFFVISSVLTEFNYYIIIFCNSSIWCLKLQSSALNK